MTPSNVGIKAPVIETKSPAPARNLRYAWYAVFVLTACYTLSFIDRMILSVLVGPIKRDLGISDTRVSLLGGLAFAMFYTLLGLPMGRIADSRNRRVLLPSGIAS